MKIIDFEKKGNVVRFYLGADDCFDYWGYDWDNAPYDCNAGRVNESYVTGIKDVNFPFDDLVLEPCNGDFNPWYTKEDMKKRRVPCIIVVPKEIYDDYMETEFSKFVAVDGIKRIYFNDPMEPDENT